MMLLIVDTSALLVGNMLIFLNIFNFRLRRIQKIFDPKGATMIPEQMKKNYTDEEILG